MKQPEFDRYSASYSQLLLDPIREFFAPGNSDFFHTRKCDLIRCYFRQSGVDTHRMSYLDVGCGQGQMISLLREDFLRVAGCDVSQGMIGHPSNLDVRLQTDSCMIPFDSAEFDFISAVCVYHHVPEDERIALTREIARVLKPGGIFTVLDHNPYNPVTKLIVSRTPVDQDAQLLSARQAKRLLGSADLALHATNYFLIFPERIYKLGGASLERWFSRIPLGGQYAIFGKKSV